MLCSPKHQSYGRSRRVKAVGRYPEELLPLRPAVFSIVVVLGNEKLHGYEIMRRIGESAGGRMVLRPSTVYGSIKRMLDDGLIEEVDDSPGPDEHRCYYVLSAFGREVALAEVERLEALVNRARAEGIAAGARGDEAGDPILGLGRDPVRTGTRDGSEAHDRYLYGG